MHLLELSSPAYDYTFKNNKGSKLVESKHVHSVTENKQPNGYSFITSYVIRQMSVTLPPYKVTLEIDPLRNVTNCTCECPAGAGKKCKHIAATIYYINNEEGLSKTTFEQEWGKPCKSGEIKYRKGKTIGNLFKNKRKFINDVDTNAVSHDILVNKYNILSLPCILSKMIEEEQRFNEFELMELFNKTKDQSENSLWHEVRNYRISASVKAHKIKTCKNLSVDYQNNLARSLLNEKVLGCQGKINVAYGKKYEEEAVESYYKLFDATILKCGIVIHAQKPWLCASLDGIVTENNQNVKVLEIKCPISCKSKLIIDHENRICNVSYLKYENNKIVLKPSHQYFTQCQILMYCTGLKKCDLFVNNKIEPVTVTIEKDDSFLKSLIARLEFFYFSFYLPNLTSK
ncbi:hypothetical protein QTP88_015789 [Uroleucon formosanum]